MTMIVVAQSLPFAALAQGDGGGLPPAVLGEVEGNKPGDTKPTPAVEPVQPVKPETVKEPAVKPESTSAHMGSPERPHTGLIEETAKAAVPVKEAPKKPVMLYGRLEEISGKAAPTFPIVLKALTPKMDQSGLLKGQASSGTLAGTVERSYPVDFRGTWGGTLTLGQLVITPLNYQLDSEESRKVASLVRPGSQGTVNFTFNQDARGNVSGSPVTITFMVPANQTNAFQSLGQVGGAGMANGAMSGMMQSMMGNMKVPIAMRFGDFSIGRNHARRIW